MRSSIAGVGLVIGVAMAALGFYIALRLAQGRPPLSGAFALDVAFAIFFLVRGAVQLRRWRGARAQVD